MPELRRDRPLASAPLTMEPVKANEAAAVRDRRAGKARGCVPTEFRNGLPEFRPYKYRGTGADIYAGMDGDERMDGAG